MFRFALSSLVTATMALSGISVAQGLEISKISNIAEVNNPGDPITYTVKVENTDTISYTGISINDMLPPSLSFVPGSARITGPGDVVLSYADDFTTIAYTNSSGDTPWLSTWIETPTDVGATGGAMKIGPDLGDNRLLLNGAGNGVNFNLSRITPLAGATSAVLTFKYRRVGLEAGKSARLDIMPTPSTFVQKHIFAGPANDAEYLDFSMDISQYNSAATRVRFRSDEDTFKGGDGFYVDDVKISYVTRGTTTTVGPDAPTLVSGLTLTPGETVTVTFSALVNQPLPGNVTDIRNEVSVTADGGYSRSTEVTDNLGSISGQVFRDDNSNGARDAGEPFLSGIQTHFVNAGADNAFSTADDIVYPAIITDASGTYEYTGLAAGQVRITVDAASLSPLGAATNENVWTAGLGLGTRIAISDVGIHLPAVVSGHVFLDGDADGINEDPRVGVNTHPIDITPATGEPFTVHTNANGDFSTTVPAGLTTITLGTVPLSAFINNTTTNSLQVVSASYGEETTVSAMGLVMMGVVRGVVFHDENRNGVMDGSEAGIGGVAVSAIFGSEFTLSTVTSGDGNYTFTGPAGPAIVSVDPASFDAAAFATTGTPAPHIVQAFQVNDIAAIGLGIPCTMGNVGGLVFNDLNGNGLQDPAEPAFSGANLALLRSDNSTATLTTDASGTYTTGTIQGETTITLNLAGLAQGSRVTTNNTTQTLTAAACAQTTFSAIGIQQLVTVSGFVFHDLEHNGVQDAGEVGLDGIVITLVDDGAVSYTVTTVAGAFSAEVVAGTTTATLVMTSFPAETEVTTPAGIIQDINTPAGTAGTFPAFGVGFRSNVRSWREY